MAFKLQENKYGQLTFMRAYQGQLKRGDILTNMAINKKIKISRLVRMHSDEMEEIQDVQCGEIFAIFGIECASGDTFSGAIILCEGQLNHEGLRYLSLGQTCTAYFISIDQVQQAFVALLQPAQT